MSDPIYIIPENPVYDPAIRALQDTDPGHAEGIFNPLMLHMISNTHANRLLLEALGGETYEGEDLTVRHFAEIAAPPHSGNPWAWIKARILAGNFKGILVKDYIPFTAGGNAFHAEVAGINTYKGYGDTEPGIGNHIDFITRECWPDTHVFNLANYNNGTSVNASPWLASDLYLWLNSLSGNVPNATTANPALVAKNYTTTGVYDKLPSEMKAVIVTKRLLLPSRYTAGSLLTDDNNWAWGDAGKLWVPSEIEVYGCTHWGTKANGNAYGSGPYQQYPIFAHNMKRVKFAANGGARTSWWLSSAIGSNSASFCHVTSHGLASSRSASSTSIRAAFGFRVS